MKKFTLFLMIACCFCLAGCSKDAEINAFITELDSATKEIVAKIDANPSSAGIDEAQKTFDAKKASLKAKWDGIKDAMGMQVSAGVKKKLEDSVVNNGKAFTDVATKNMMALAKEPDSIKKLQALSKDYMALFTPPGSK